MAGKVKITGNSQKLGAFVSWLDNFDFWFNIVTPRARCSANNGTQTMCAICDFKIEFDVSHALALTVAVATRQAIEAGTLAEQNFDGPLGSVKLRVAAIETLKDLQARLEAAMPPSELTALPDFYVLLIENGTWGFFRATADGFDPDVVPDLPEVTSDDPAERDNVVVASETCMRSVLDGEIALGRAMAEGLLVLDAQDADRERLRDALSVALEPTHTGC
jgi:hypothetical protein